MSVRTVRDVPGVAGVAALAAAVFVALAGAVTWLWHAAAGGRYEVVDIAHYRFLAERILGGGVPYRDVPLEYPPGAMASFLPPGLLTGSFGAYYVVFATAIAALGAAAVVVVASLLRDTGVPASGRRWRLALVALSPAALGGVVLTRFDLLPALLLLLALQALVRGRERTGFLLLGAGIAVKVYPAVVLPVAVAWVWRRRGRGPALARLGEALVAPAGLYVAFAAVAPGGVGDSLWRQLARPLQIESLASGVLLALHQATGLALSWSSGSGSQNLDGRAAGVLAAVSSLLGAAALVAVWLRFLRGPATTDRLIRHAAASVVAFVAFSKVLSPQYLVWLVLLVPLATGPGTAGAAGLLVAATVLTGVWFPGRYWRLVEEFDPLASWLVLPRGLLLVALLGVLVLTDAGRAPARSPSPVPLPRT